MCLGFIETARPKIGVGEGEKGKEVGEGDREAPSYEDDELERRFRDSQRFECCGIWDGTMTRKLSFKGGRTRERGCKSQ